METVKKELLLGALVALVLASSLPVVGQEAPKPVPVITGYGGFVANFEPNKQTLNPVLAPIFLVPVGKRVLIEAEFEAESEFEREDGVWGPKTLEEDIEYLQIDFIAHRNLTIVAGRFLTPFGTFNERLHPVWIRNLQPAPFIFGMEHGSSNGFMLRGGARLASNVNLNYSGYFSALSTVHTLDSNRSAGGRWSLFFPHQRFEAGVSYSRLLGDERFNFYGFDVTWNVRQIPLDIRSEYARSVVGSGYWLEGAYRLNRIQAWNSFFRRSQIVGRVEQFFAPFHEEEEMEAEEGEEHTELPEHDTQRIFVGWNYYIRDGFKLSFAYGRSFTSEDNRNIWSIGLAYRFLF